jgi:SAM-dependent methyltransferase
VERAIMSRRRTEKPDYGNWVSKRLIYMPAVVALFFLALSIVSYLFIIVAVFFLIILVYFAYAYYKFSPKGGDLQVKIRELVLDRLIWDGEGRALDIGCGNGALVIKLAKKYPKARVTGIDYWGGKWGYSKETCEKNAEIEGVPDRTTFQRASAASLPFEDESFEAAISNFVFHEVKDARDKRSAVREALRVVKKGGVFVFQDLFLDKKVYGEINDLMETIRGWGVQNVQFVNTSNMECIPKPLKIRFMLGSIGIIYGNK